MTEEELFRVRSKGLDNFSTDPRAGVDRPEPIIKIE